MKLLRLLTILVAATLCCLWTTPIEAQNPIIHDRYTPDPAPYVHGDTLYLFVDHDENETLNGYFRENTAQDGFDRSNMEVINDMAPGWTLVKTMEGVATWTGVDFLNN